MGLATVRRFAFGVLGGLGLAKLLGWILGLEHVAVAIGLGVAGLIYAFFWEAEAQTAAMATARLRDNAAQMETELSQRAAALAAADEERRQLKNQIGHQETQIQDLTAETTGLGSRIADLLAQLQDQEDLHRANLEDREASYQATLTDIHGRLGTAQATLDAYIREQQAAQQAQTAAEQVIQGRLAGVGSETLITLLKRHFGWAFARQTGSHLILTKTLSLSVPRRRDLPQGTLAGILRQAGISREEFLKVLR